MGSLAAELLRILRAEAAYPALSVESLVKLLHAIGYGDGRLDESVIEGALSELMAGGTVERVHSARLGPRYRVMVESRPVVAAAGNRT